MRLQVKICGIKTGEALDAAVSGGASFIGFVFHPASPRNLSLEAGARLRQSVPASLKAVALIADAGDELIAEITRRVAPDIFQLHGTESPKRVAAIKALTGRPVLKALPVARAEDLAAAARYEEIADWLMFDAKPAPGASAQGGGGQSFDWKLLGGRSFRRPWFLAGGLKAENVKEAAEITGAKLLDVSSGVERTRGDKDPALISAFLDRVRAL